ncbi:MAG: tRNA (adenosine(37)-N6)-threonylcarbamoyltransferase complex ATPase subunit type 1 TsaE [Planctomycetaceae bacterium]|nr:tRNA (adenosine(37)-N6)-threonylcarbamoyltransferase complex ATPase subunit type 1 TsaE [Planctomycetaceae bacterium]
MNAPAREEVFTTDSVEATQALGAALAARFTKGDCVALIGLLGAGKTALVRGLAAGLGVQDTRVVCSPTYVIVHEYAGRLPVYHLDLYRLGGPEEFVDLAVEEMLAEGVVIIEWAERARQYLPRRRWQIEIEITGKHSRRLRLTRVER